MNKGFLYHLFVGFLVFRISVQGMDTQEDPRQTPSRVEPQMQSQNQSEIRGPQSFKNFPKAELDRVFYQVLLEFGKKRGERTSRKQAYAMTVRMYQILHIPNPPSSADAHRICVRCLSDVSTNSSTWSKEEDDLLRALIKTYGFQWSKMVKFFQGRSMNQLRSRWQRFKKKGYGLNFIVNGTRVTSFKNLLNLQSKTEKNKVGNPQSVEKKLFVLPMINFNQQPVPLQRPVPVPPKQPVLLQRPVPVPPKQPVLLQRPVPVPPNQPVLRQRPIPIPPKCRDKPNLFY